MYVKGEFILWQGIPQPHEVVLLIDEIDENPRKIQIFIPVADGKKTFIEVPFFHRHKVRWGFYAITDSGGYSPNVVQAQAEVLYLIRAPKTAQVQEIYERVCNIAKGAALMTGTEVNIVFDKACSNVIQNATLESTLHQVMGKIGVPTFSEEELAFAKDLQSSLSAADIAEEFGKYPQELEAALKEKPMAEVIIPYSPVFSNRSVGGSTDVGDVSWIAPTAQVFTACWVLGTPAHTWQVVTIGATSIAHKGMLQAGKVLAGAALEVIKNPELLEKAKQELKERLGDSTYQCPIPADVMPSRYRNG
ncbi:hypothetical protein [Brevibacillus nitrificans]|uniref:hypothetical protein n=1 Tax=Brevibacillus nitrificans TaxID=651560 RepID=UPI00285F5D75|nr:hypothetical protein [Brevibacillus nitrificans]MDR7317134.1 metal-dependent amidase/aminoacylase/carboxypeptidase family protein [Brevibacillus nitrificans]